MKVELTKEHRQVLETIASEVAKLLERGTADTGPGGANGAGLLKDLRDMESELDYYLGES
jgi:hypothetical protein